MQLAFRKMQGTGNRILVVDQRQAGAVAPSADVVAALRNAEPGFDQLMWLTLPTRPATAASYRVFNNDGSEVEQCGNGVRCVAILLAAQNPAQTDFLLESPAGLIATQVLGDGRAAVNMGPPRFDDATRHLDVNGKTVSVSIVSMGNPHCILDVDDVDTAPVDTLGPALETHARFPNRSNIGFMQVLDRHNIRLRVHERGVGETQACGTGACAAVVVGRRDGRLDDDVTVHLPGGQLMVSWRGDSAAVWLTGDAELISEGIIDL